MSNVRHCGICGGNPQVCKCVTPPLKIVPLKPKDTIWPNGAPDMIASFASDVAAGKVKPTKAIIIFVEDSDNGASQTPHYWTTKLNSEEVIAWCEMTKVNAIKDWKSGE